MGRVKEFVEEEALAKARDVFWRLGYEATSLSDLTDEMQIQRASLYNTFGSKAELFERALAQYQENSLLLVEEILSLQENPTESIRHLLLTAVPEECFSEKRKGCFCVNVAVELGGQDPNIALRLESHFAQVRTRIAKTIASGQAQGVFAITLSPLEAAGYILSCLNGLYVTAKTTTDTTALHRQIEMILKALLP